MSITILPYNDRIIVRPVEREKITKGGLIIPETIADRPVRGTVIAVGPGVLSDDGTRTPVQPQPGDEVYYGKFAGTEFNIDGVKHLLMREVDIICQVRESDAITPGALSFSTVEPISIELDQNA